MVLCAAAAAPRYVRVSRLLELLVYRVDDSCGCARGVTCSGKQCGELCRLMSPACSSQSQRHSLERKNRLKPKGQRLLQAVDI